MKCVRMKKCDYPKKKEYEIISPIKFVIFGLL